MTTPRKTANPFSVAVTGKVRAHTIWNDGYKCGHSDAEMDERDRAQYLVKANNDMAGRIDNLIEKNGNQVKTIKHLDGQVNDLRTIREDLRDENDRLRAEIADEKRIVKLFAEDKRLLADEVKRLTRDNSARGNSILDAQAKIRELEAAGKDAIVAELIVHLQGYGSTVKFLTDHQHKKLKGVLNTVRTHAAELDDEINGLDGTADMLENVLTDIECPPRA